MHIFSIYKCNSCNEQDPSLLFLFYPENKAKIICFYCRSEQLGLNIKRPIDKKQSSLKENTDECDESYYPTYSQVMADDNYSYVSWQGED